MRARRCSLRTPAKEKSRELTSVIGRRARSGMLDNVDYFRRRIASTVKDIENTPLLLIYRVFLILQRVCGRVSLD